MAGAQAYLALRSLWDPYISELAPAMAYSMVEIDPASQDPDSTGQRPNFRARLRDI